MAACKRFNPDKTLVRCHDKGILRLNWVHTTLVLNVKMPEFSIDNRINDHITEPLTMRQCEDVKRVYELTRAPLYYYDPSCCWACSWKRKFSKHRVLQSRFNDKQFPNVCLCQKLIGTEHFDQTELCNHYNSMAHFDDLWMAIRDCLVNCNGYPVAGYSDDTEWHHQRPDSQ